MVETEEDVAARVEDGAFPAAPHLFLVFEADNPRTRGARHELSGVNEIAVGRAASRTFARVWTPGGTRLELGVADRWMSTAHARIVREPGGWVLHDAGSRNGTFVGGQRITRAELGSGAFIEMGHTFFRFRDDLPTPPAGPRDVDAADLEALAPGLRSLVPALRARGETLRRIASTPISVLIRGPSGAGKELAARAVHSYSGRTGKFVAVNCGAIPAGLVEALLFGHTRGAFSSAVRDEPGFIREAHGGTLFLDELADLPLAAQPALLRVLEEREVVAVGTTRGHPVDVRVVAATHQPIEDRARVGAFREDLLARLNGFTHAVPPLGDRMEDFGFVLAEAVARSAGTPPITLAPSAARALLAHHWPLNAREAHNALAAAIALAPDGHILATHLPTSVAGASFESGQATPPATGISISIPKDPDALRAMLTSQLVAHAGNVAAVARALGKGPVQIHRWMKRFGLNADDFRA